MAQEVNFGLTLSSEEHPPRRLVALAKLAEDAGFDFVSISDHFHPWVGEQGHSPFVWSVLGAIAEATDHLQVAVGVTCPTIRIHPVILAQATATTSRLLDGRFVWGVGTGENLNEHVVAQGWPPFDLRIEMLQEAVAVIRELWRGESVTHWGEYFSVEDATIFDTPESPIPVIVSAFGEEAATVAARIGDGLWTSSANEPVLEAWRQAGGSGPVYSQLTLCYGEDRDKAIDTAHRLWPNTGLPGQLPQDLRTPRHFEQATELVTREVIAGEVPCGPDPYAFLGAARRMIDAGIDHLYFHQIGDAQEAFLELWKEELEPALRG